MRLDHLCYMYIKIRVSFSAMFDHNLRITPMKIIKGYY